MEKLPLCRICLADNVRMFVVVNRNLHKLYEMLTNTPFVTEDNRPILACFLCCTKLKHSYRLLMQCLEAEGQFAQMKNEQNEPNALKNQEHNKIFNGFVTTTIVHISIVDECETESIVAKEETPADCEELHDVIELDEEHEEHELEPEKLGEQEPENLDEQEPENLHEQEPENLDSCLDVCDLTSVLTPNNSESDLEDDVPLMEFKTKMQEVSKEAETAGVTVTKEPKERRTKLEDGITAEQTRKSELKVIWTNQKRTSKPDIFFEELNDQRSFNQEKEMIQHTPPYIGENPYKCDVCQLSFNQKSNLSMHSLLKHTGEKPYKCYVCHRSFGANDSLTKHIRIHTFENPFKCHLCPRSFMKKNALINHKRIHAGEKPFKCHICQCNFRHSGTLSTHLLSHTGEKPFKCFVCQRSFTRKHDLTKHNRVHTGEKSFKCNICRCSFYQESDLTTHIRQHSDEKPYKCSVCHRSFKQKSRLTKHSYVHTSEKPYKCDVCQRSFSLKEHIYNHIMHTHIGVKRYKCAVCQRRFRSNSALKIHNRVHTGEKPFECAECHRTFRVRCTLIKHIQFVCHKKC